MRHGLQRTALVVLATLALAGCGSREPSDPLPSGPGPVLRDDGVAHIHGLGVDPADDALIIATHTGLFRASDDRRRPQRIGDRRQDTMGFTVVGPNRFLGSGHPDLRDRLPSSLGLIKSDDAGRSWQSVSLLGEADFHILRAAGRLIYAADAGTGTLLVSTDGGRHWRTSRPPSPLVDLAIDPANPDRVIASDQQGLISSADRGATWKRLPPTATGLLAWSSGLVLIDAAGTVRVSLDVGNSFKRVGAVDGAPTALAVNDGELLVALADNSIWRSSNGGRRWLPRVKAD